MGAASLNVKGGALSEEILHASRNPIGSIRPYLVAACKWYSEADTGPGAEAGAGFGAGFPD